MMVASEGTALLRVGDVDCPTVEDAHFSAVRRAFGIAAGNAPVSST